MRSYAGWVGHWRRWKHKEKPDIYCYVPADVVFLSVNGGRWYLGRRGFSPFTTLRSLPVLLPPYAAPTDYPADALMAAYAPDSL